MLSIKVIYNEATASKVSELLRYKDSPMFEFYNEDIPKELKEAWKYKGTGGTKNVPYIGVYEGNKLIKAFYSEDGSATSSNVLVWLNTYLRDHAKKGYMTVTKLEGKNNDKITLGSVHEGHTDAFIEGLALLLSTADRWFHTSTVLSINWEDGTFKTRNSTYKFTLNDN